MRRGLSILLALLFGVGPLSAALPGGDETGLPACCRRHGAHHCTMSAQMSAMVARAESGKSAVSAPSTCPRYPGFTIALLTPVHALASAVREFAVPESATRPPLPTDPQAASTSGNTRAGRGPPTQGI